MKINFIFIFIFFLNYLDGNVLETFKSLLKMGEYDSLEMKEVITQAADDNFLKLSAEKLRTSLGLPEDLITPVDLFIAADCSTSTGCGHNLCFQELSLKEMKAKIGKLKSLKARETESAFKDYTSLGISISSQREFLTLCSEDGPTITADFTSLYTAPLLVKAYVEQKTILNSICFELDQLLIEDDRPYIPKAFCLLGGPGSGKTFLIDCLIEQCMARKVGLISCAFAASACLHICSCLPNGTRIVSNTLNSTLALSIFQTNQTLKGLEPLKEGVVDELRRGPFKDVHVFVVDEISMVTESVVSHVADRLRQLSPKSYSGNTYGKFVFVACGDFKQLPPPKASSLYEGVVKKYILGEGLVFFKKYLFFKNIF